MFADFRNATQGTGKSFKGALDYFLNDKGQEQEQPTTDDRVDVLELRNLATQNPRHAWFEMMNTAKASGALKEAAGIKKGGRQGEKPVFTYHLAWHDSQRPERAAMLDAARSTLQLLGLQDHQALIVAHTDTAHPHVHVIVNRVNPETGLYAGLPNSWKALKGWAIDYSKQHGTHWHIPLEQAKEAHAARRQTARTANFNRSAEGKPPPQTRTASPKPPPPKPSRAEWQGRKSAGNQNNPDEAEAAASLKAVLAAKWSAYRKYEQQAVVQQQNEKSALWVDRKAARSAIYEKYNEANQAVWKAERPRPEARFRPSPLTEKTLKDLSRGRREFEKLEQSMIGRLSNAGKLARGQSLFAIIRLALNPGERRRLFDLAQRKTANQGRQGVEQKVRAGWVPETRRMQADRLKVMRAAELARFDKETETLRRQMGERHQINAEGAAAMKAALSASGKEAWAQHAAKFRGSNVMPAREQPAKDQTAQRPQQAAKDRFGRSRDRKPRQPRAEREERAGEGATATSDPQETQGTGEAFRKATGASIPQSNLDRAEAAYNRRPTETAALARVKAQRAAERGALERDEDRGRGRER